MPKPKEDKKFGPYEWGENTLKLARAKKYVADREANNQVAYTSEEEREAAVKERYIETAGHITGTKMVRPRPAHTTFGGQPTVNDEDEDDE